MSHITNHSGSNVNSFTKMFGRLYQSKRDCLKNFDWSANASIVSAIDLSRFEKIADIVGGLGTLLSSFFGKKIEIDMVPYLI